MKELIHDIVAKIDWSLALSIEDVADELRHNGDDESADIVEGFSSLAHLSLAGFSCDHHDISDLEARAERIEDLPAIETEIFWHHDRSGVMHYQHTDGLRALEEPMEDVADSYDYRLRKAGGLGEICSLLNEAVDTLGDAFKDFDITDLPCAGEEPEDTTGIWAYDDHRMIVSVNNGAAPSTFKIVDR